MNTSQDPLKRYAFVALTALLVLLAGSLVFYKERMLFIDATGTLFRTINMKMLQIPESRFGSVATLWVPFTGQKFHWSLKTIMIVYSLSFHLFYFTVASVLLFVFRQHLMAVLMALIILCI